VLVTLEQLHQADAPLGLPAGSFTIRNSARVVAACPRRWWFKVGEGLQPRVEARALTYGTAWHATMDDVHRVWMRMGDVEYTVEDLDDCSWCGRFQLAERERCPRCKGSGSGPVGRAATAWFGTDREEDTLTLARAAVGWLARWGGRPPAGMRVVGVELGLSMPIRLAKGNGAWGAVYTPELYVVRSPEGRERLARTGEALPGRLPSGWTCELQRCPAHLQARLDNAWMDGRALWVGEFKTSLDPARYLSGLSVDPQVGTYELVLQHAVERGLLAMPSADCAGGVPIGSRVAGWWYDVSSSRKQRDPHILQGRAKKDGTRVGGGAMSTAQNNLASLPSWRLQWALEEAQEDAEGRKLGLSAEEAAALLIDQEMKVDRKLYLRESGASGVQRLEEIRLELLAEARRSAAMHRAAARAEDYRAVAEAFPRVPVCRVAGGNCAYRGPCYNDSPEAREYFETPKDLGTHGAIPDGEDVWEDEDRGEAGSSWEA
jgi:hypothetical protein